MPDHNPESEKPDFTGLVLVGLAVLSQMSAMAAFKDTKSTDSIEFGDSIAIAWETRAAVDLLRNGHRLLSLEEMGDEYNSIIVLLSGGVEKMLRLATGHLKLAGGGAWPDDFKKQGHQLKKMNESLFETVVGNESCPAEVHVAVIAVSNDPVWNALLEVLDSYAQQGRFYLQDLLAKKNPPGERDPTDGWLNVLAAADSVAVQVDDPELSFTALRSQIQYSLIQWWELIAKLAAAGLLSPRGIQWAKSIEPESVLER